MAMCVSHGQARRHARGLPRAPLNALAPGGAGRRAGGVSHGLLPHLQRARYRSPVSRHAYALHATDAGTDYAATDWLQRNANQPVRGFLI